MADSSNSVTVENLREWIMQYIAYSIKEEKTNRTLDIGDSDELELLLEGLEQDVIFDVIYSLRGPGDKTALHFAVNLGHIEIVHTILESLGHEKQRELLWIAPSYCSFDIPSFAVMFSSVMTTSTQTRVENVTNSYLQPAITHYIPNLMYGFTFIEIFKCLLQSFIWSMQNRSSLCLQEWMLATFLGTVTISQLFFMIDSMHFVTAASAILISLQCMLDLTLDQLLMYILSKEVAMLFVFVLVWLIDWLGRWICIDITFVAIRRYPCGLLPNVVQITPLTDTNINSVIQVSEEVSLRLAYYSEALLFDVMRQKNILHDIFQILKEEGRENLIDELSTFRKSKNLETFKEYLISYHKHQKACTEMESIFATEKGIQRNNVGSLGAAGSWNLP